MEWQNFTDDNGDFLIPVHILGNTDESIEYTENRNLHNRKIESCKILEVGYVIKNPLQSYTTDSLEEIIHDPDHTYDIQLKLTADFKILFEDESGDISKNYTKSFTELGIGPLIFTTESPQTEVPGEYT